MGILDGPLRGVAMTLIGRFGTTATFVTPGGVFFYDPETGKPVRDPEAEQTVSVVVEDYPALQTSGGEAAAQDIRRGDKKLTVAAAALRQAPTTETVVRFGGLEYTVVKVDAVYSGDQVALYVLQVRR